jgi:hypothetical protein
MDILEKLVDWVVWALIISGMAWLAFGCYTLIDLFFIRG